MMITAEEGTLIFFFFFIIIIFFFFTEKIRLDISCLADDSHKMLSFFSEK